MSTVVSFNGTNYTVPATGERAWGGQVSAYLIAIASGSLQKTGGSFTLTAADVDFGATYGLRGVKFASRSTPATTGIFRLGNNESVAWRNQANSADLALKVNASNILEFGGNPLLTLALGAADTALRMNGAGTAYEWAALTNANIDAAAAIAYSKLNLALSIVNADISTSAAIADTKLATIATAGKVSNSATTATNANTASAIVARDSSGNFSAGTITASLTGNASGTAANITGIAAIANGGTGQATKAAAYDALSPTTTQGDLEFRNGSTNTRLGIGTAGQVLKVNSGATAPEWGDAGGGSGEINVVENPSAASATTGVTNGTSHTVARVTGSNSPLNTVVATAFSFTATSTAVESSTSGNYWTFTMPAALRNRKLAIKAYYTTEASQTWAISIRNTTGRRTLDTDSSGATTLPAGTTGQYVGSFDTDSDTGNYTLHFTRTAGSGTAVLYVTLVIVGPGTIAPVPAIGPWIAYTPAISSSGGSLTLNATGKVDPYGFYRRVGDSVEIQIDFRNGSGGAATGSAGNLRFSLPTGITGDSTKLINNFSFGPLVGDYSFYNGSTAVDGNWGLCLVSGFLTPIKSGTGDFVKLADIVASYNGSLRAVFPVAEWAGAPNYAGSNDFEIASNNGTWDADNTTSFSYGPAGSTMTGALSSGRSKRVRFLSPIQQSDRIEIEISEDGLVWFPMNGFINMAASNFVTNSINAGGSINLSSGAYFKPVSGSTTDIDVTFARYSYIANDDSPVGDWVSGWRWRVVKARAGAAVGFGAATQSSLGLVRGGLVPGNSGAAAITSGYAGEVISVTPSTTGTSTTTADTPVDGWTAGTNELTLGPGSWRVTFTAAVYISYASSLSAFGSVYLHNVTDAATVSRSHAGFGATLPASSGFATTVGSTVYLNITSTKTYRLRLQINQSSAGAVATLYGNNSPSGSGNLLQTNIIAERI